MISQEELERLDLDPTSIKITDPKTGNEGYRAGLEVFHQLHCLNLLRQYTWRGYYKDQGGDISDDQEEIRAHIGMNNCNQFNALTDIH
jgi:hypothetical protein